MKKNLMLTVGAWLVSTAVLLAEGVPFVQTPEPPLPMNAGLQSYPLAQSCGVDGCPAPKPEPAPQPTPGPQFWGGGEYLLWWVKSAPLIPIATVGSTTDAIPGALGQPNTRVFSPNTLNYGPFSGGRATLGAWLDEDRTFGLEASGFLLETRSASFLASRPPGTTIYYVPYFDQGTNPARQNAYAFGNENATAGGIAASNSLQLWGVEANGLFNVLSNDSFTLSAIGGFRYLDLSEELSMAFLGTGAPAPVSSLLSLDRYSTHNQFWGGQLGMRAEARFGGLFVNLTGLIGLGDVRERVYASGLTSNLTTGGSVPNGFFTQPTTLGRQATDAFAVVPELRAYVGYNVTENVRVFAGYNFLYVSNVVRPGHQINVIRPGDGPPPLPPPVPPPPPPPPVIQVNPLPQLNHTDFWADGISFGVVLNF